MEKEGSDDTVSLFLKLQNSHSPLKLVIRMVIV